LCALSFVDLPSVLRYCWLGLLTCKNRLPYNLYCVGGDVKHCSLTHFWSGNEMWPMILLMSCLPGRHSVSAGWWPEKLSYQQSTVCW